MGCLAVPAVWALLALAARHAAAGLVRTRDDDGCNAATWKGVLPDNAVITNISFVPKGGSAGEGPVNLLYPINPTDLPELCSVTVQVTSSPTSSYRFGLFLPSAPHDWKGRFFAVGNGGFGGGINWLEMAVGAHLGAASVSTDTGHSSIVTDTTWALNQPEKKNDWGWRALHGTVEIGKKMTEAFYAKPVKYSYYSGCSTGGRQGLREIQLSPTSFDGVLIGAPSWYVSTVNPFATALGVYNLPVTAPHHIPIEQFGMMNKAVIAQCDEVDGVKDGIVSSPELCTFDFSKIKCGNPAADPTNCLTDAKIATAKKIYGDFVSERGEFWYSGLTLSGEDTWYILMGGVEPSPFGLGYVRNFLYDDPTWQWPMYNDTVVYNALANDPGKPTAAKYDISPYRARGGKVVLYHGLADSLVATKGSQLYYNRTVAAMGNVDSWFRYFEIPGMAHCAGTSCGAPWNIGAAFQSTAMGTDQWSVPGYRDSNHDAMMGLIDWVEKGEPVDYIVATTWNSQYDRNSGVLRQRPVCPWPKKAKYNNRGSIDHASSWKCG